MDSILSRPQAAGFLFTSVLGTFLHFLFDLTGGSAAAALVSAVNESIWEHMKLIYYPMVLFAGLQALFRRPVPETFWCIKLASVSLGLVLVPVLYYSYTGILGISADWFNVTIFFLAAFAAYRLEELLRRRAGECRLSSRWALLLLVGIGIVFTYLTFFPPRIPFFRDPVTGSYGFPG